MVASNPRVQLAQNLVDATERAYIACMQDNIANPWPCDVMYDDAKEATVEHTSLLQALYV